MRSGQTVSGDGQDGTDVGPMPRIKGVLINKSPMFYLRRRRNTTFDRHTPGVKEMRGGIMATTSIRPDYPKPDDGSIYPHHSSVQRLGDVEWTMYREYMDRIPKWIKKTELVIDGQ